MIPVFVKIHRLGIFLCILLFSLGSLFASEEEKWVFAASKYNSSIENDATAELIPLYILQNFSDSLVRTVTKEEQFRYEVQLIDDEISALYEDLQATVLKKDALVFTLQKNSDYENDREEIELEIEYIKKEIQEKKDLKDSISLDTFTLREQSIGVWNDNISSLYPFENKAYYFNPKDIQALITGNIEYVDSFVYVTTYLTLYPGKEVIITIIEADTITSIQSLSKRIADKIFIALTNKDVTTITFSINPPEAQVETTIYINGTAVEFDESESTAFASIDISRGIHEFYIESPGYERVNVTHSFLEEEDYLVDIHLKEENIASLSFSVPVITGNLFLNTKKANSEAAQENETTGIVTINGLPALGEFVNTDGITTWFLLDSDKDIFSLDSAEMLSFSLIPDTKNFADIIEKNRKRMYNSYAALIVSLPLYFIANGQYVNEYNSWATGKASGDDIEFWQTARDVTMGAAIGLGVNFLVQLGIYIYSANAILPNEITVR